MSQNDESVAEGLFAQFLSQVEAGADPDFEEFLQAHAEHEGELRAMHADWRILGEAGDDPPSGFSFFGMGGHAAFEEGPDLIEGQVFGDYELVAFIDRGGMGEVWRAAQISLGRRQVALKFISPEKFTPRRLELFQREARAGGRLTHAGIVSVYGAGTDEGVAWLAMELVEGGRTLRDFLDEVAREPGFHSDYDRRVASFVAEVADAMQAAHGAGVIHRDLKPQNILITTDDQPKVTDFGLARIVEEPALSRTGTVVGSYYYMSPEQVDAHRSGLDHRTDVFSLGVVLYEMLALQRPFQGDTSHQIADQIRFEDPPDLRTLRSRVPIELAVIAGKAMEKDRDRRYGSMADFAADVRRFLNHEPIVAQPPTSLHRAVKWARRHPTISVAGALALIAMGVILMLLLDLKREADSVKRLSALQDCDELLERSQTLWPPEPKWIPAYNRLILQAEALIQDLPTHRQELLRLTESMDSAVRPGRLDAELNPVDYDSAVAHELPGALAPVAQRELLWWSANLSRLIATLEGFQEPGGLLGADSQASLATGWSIPARLELARSLADGFQEGGEYSAAWVNAIKEIGRLDIYRDVVVTPQMGLVPLWMNPGSGLWEFWHVASGDRPVRDSEGRIDMTAATGLVLVLLPGGDTWVGAQKEDPDARNYDGELGETEIPLETPPVQRTVAPFFISKFELTQAQLLRLSGLECAPLPAAADAGNHAAQGVKFGDAHLVLERFGLRVPGEVEWEYAARAGTSTAYETGTNLASVEGAANLCDQATRALGPDWQFVEWNDGWGTTAPVGQFRANAFGLHDCTGNVWEWTVPDRSMTERDDQPGPDQLVLRGNSWQSPPNETRVAYRYLVLQDHTREEVGVRPCSSLSN